MKTHLYFILLATSVCAAPQMSSIAELLTLLEQIYSSVAEDTQNANCVNKIFEGTELLKNKLDMNKFSAFFQKFERLKQSLTPSLGKEHTERKNPKRFIEKLTTFIRKSSKKPRAAAQRGKDPGPLPDLPWARWHFRPAPARRCRRLSSAPQQHAGEQAASHRVESSGREQSNYPVGSRTRAGWQQVFKRLAMKCINPNACAGLAAVATATANGTLLPLADSAPIPRHLTPNPGAALPPWSGPPRQRALQAEAPPPEPRSGWL
nr:PREDICTED: uncharacterized protein LOC104147040 [Struthio camelus australis]